MIAATVAVTIAMIQIPVDVIRQLGSYGYLGVFALTLVSSASIVLPSPITIGAALVAGRTLDPWLIGVAAGLGAGIGEITGYVAGRGGSPLIVSSRFYPRIERWVRRWAMLTIFILAATPGPLLDIAGVAAGATHVPFFKFVLPCTLGKVLRFMLVAWIGRLFL